MAMLPKIPMVLKESMGAGVRVLVKGRGKHLLEFGSDMYMVVTNTMFNKSLSRLITYSPGGENNQTSPYPNR